MAGRRLGALEGGAFIFLPFRVVRVSRRPSASLQVRLQRRVVAAQLTEILGYSLQCCIKALEIAKDDKEKAASIVMDSPEEVWHALEMDQLQEDKHRRDAAHKPRPDGAAPRAAPDLPFGLQFSGGSGCVAVDARAAFAAVAAQQALTVEVAFRMAGHTPCGTGTLLWYGGSGVAVSLALDAGQVVLSCAARGQTAEVRDRPRPDVVGNRTPCPPQPSSPFPRVDALRRVPCRPSPPPHCGTTKPLVKGHVFLTQRVSAAVLSTDPPGVRPCNITGRRLWGGGGGVPHTPPSTPSAASPSGVMSGACPQTPPQPFTRGWPFTKDMHKGPPSGPGVNRMLNGQLLCIAHQLRVKGHPPPLPKREVLEWPYTIGGGGLPDPPPGPPPPPPRRPK